MIPSWSNLKRGGSDMSYGILVWARILPSVQPPTDERELEAETFVRGAAGQVIEILAASHLRNTEKSQAFVAQIERLSDATLLAELSLGARRCAVASLEPLFYQALRDHVRKISLERLGTYRDERLVIRGSRTADTDNVLVASRTDRRPIQPSHPPGLARAPNPRRPSGGGLRGRRGLAER